MEMMNISQKRHRCSALGTIFRPWNGLKLRNHLLYDVYSVEFLSSILRLLTPFTIRHSLSDHYTQRHLTPLPALEQLAQSIARPVRTTLV